MGIENQNILEIDGRLLYPIKEVVEKVSYSRDYITQLARDGKVFATQIDRQWFIDLASVQSYSESIRIEQSLRHKHLSEDRKFDHELRLRRLSQGGIFTDANRLLRARIVPVLMLFILLGGLFGFFNQVKHKTQNENVSFLSSFLNAGTFFEMQKEMLAALQGLRTDSVGVEVDKVNQPAVVLTEVEMSMQSLGSDDFGILLFPGSSTAEVSGLFSDEVSIKKVSGSEVYEIQYQDDSGNAKTSKNIPFVRIPVSK